MIYIHGWDDMRKYGFDLLTGEACALVYRGLFDLTPEALEIVERTIGAVEIQAPSAWNSKGTYSLLMPYILLEPLAVFALFEIEKVQRIVLARSEGRGEYLIGAANGELEELLERTRAKSLEDYFSCRGVHVKRLLTYPEQRPGITRGLSNVHQMTGRSA